MSWYKVFGHEREKEILQRSIADNMESASYLFWGPEGSGKDALAIEFAKVLNCLKPVVSGKDISACDKCTSCMQIDKLIHPNLKLVFALPTGKTAGNDNESPLAKLSEAQMEEITEHLEIKAKSKYHKIQISNASQIRINSIREVKKFVSMSKASAGIKVVIVSRADEMNTESANALLKTLEEPNENTIIILTSSKKEILPQTILSRCRQMYVPALDSSIVEKYLIDSHNLELEQAKLIAAFSQGSITMANNYLNENFQELKNTTVDLLRNSLKGKTYRVNLMNLIDNLIKSGDRTTLVNSLLMLMIWIHDAYKLKLLGTTNHIINIDQIDSLSKFANHYNQSDFNKAISYIENAIGEIKRNVNQHLVFLSLFIKLRRIFLVKS